MFKRSPPITQLVDAVYALTVALKRGDILPHSDIQAILKVHPNGKRWTHVMNIVRRLVLNRRSIAMWPVYGVGYRFLTEDQQIELLDVYQERAHRRLLTGERYLRALESADLDDFQRDQIRYKLVLNQQMIKSLDDSIEHLKRFRKPAESNPMVRRPPPPQEDVAAMAKRLLAEKRSSVVGPAIQKPSAPMIPPSMKQGPEMQPPNPGS